MDSTIVGLDLTASLSRPSARDCDQDALEHLLMIAEAAVVSTLIEEKKNAE